MTDPIALKIDRMATPVGELVLIADAQDRLKAIDWTDHEARMLELLGRYCGKAGFTLKPSRNPGGLSTALRDYFKGALAAIDRLPADTGGTDFQRKVWRELRRIPCGKTISYAELAKRIGKPAAIRAAGTANGAN